MLLQYYVEYQSINQSVYFVLLLVQHELIIGNQKDENVREKKKTIRKDEKEKEKINGSLQLLQR